MNCETATAPIDINNNPTGTCDLKCKFNFKYKESGSKLKNNMYYLSLTHDQVYPAPVNFNAEDYQVNEIRIYSPSLHTYSGTKTAAELIILHRGPQKSLLVCLPIINGDNSTSKPSIDIASIIMTAKKFARKPDDETPIQKNFNLNDFIPNNKPFYSYKATLPFDSCDGEYNYVVFSKDDGAYISLSKELLFVLKTIIKPHSIEVKPDTKFFINKLGANINSGKSEEIYIDCKPVSDDGIVIDDGKVIDDFKTNNESQQNSKKINFNDIKNNIFFQILFGFISIFLILYIFKYLVRKILGKSNVNNADIRQSSS